jgi:dipeptidyl aminopeptidase/acylaminoacyl peptidase
MTTLRYSGLIRISNIILRSLGPLLSAVLCATPSLAVSQPSTLRALRPGDLITQRQFGAIAESQDGRFVAIEVRHRATPGLVLSDDDALEGHTILWVANTDGRTRFPVVRDTLTHGTWAPLWSPSGHKLAFLSTARSNAALVCIWDSQKHRSRVVSPRAVDLQAVTHSVRSDPIRAFLWLDDNTLLVVFLPRGVTSLPFSEMSGDALLSAAALDSVRGGVTVTAVVAASMVALRDSVAAPTADLVSLNVSSGASRILAHIPLVQTRLSKRFVEVSPNSHFAAIIANTNAYPRLANVGQLTLGNLYPSTLGIVSLVDSTMSERWVTGIEPLIAGDSHNWLSLAWAPDDMALGLIGHTNTTPVDAAYAYDTVVAVVSSQAGVLKSAINLRSHLESNGSTKYPVKLDWAAGSDLVVSTRDHRSWRVIGDSLVENRDTIGSAIAKSAPHNRGCCRVAADGSLLTRTADADSVVIFPALNPGLSAVAPPEYRALRYVGINGDSLNATVLLPFGYDSGRRYPLVVAVYAGSLNPEGIAHFASPVEYTAFNLMLLSAHGYAVLLPSMPLRPYGLASDPLPHLNDGVGPAIDKVVSLGIADSTRVGLIGISYGGYSVYGLMTQSHRFRAAVVMNGISDLTSLYGAMDPRYRASEPDFAVGTDPYYLETAQGRMGRAPWEDPERYRRNSPISFVDQVTTPVLILHGDLDLLGIQDEEFYTALWRLGKPAEFVRYLGEHHDMLSGANIIDMWQRIYGWFDTYLVSQPTRQPSG